MLEGKSILVVDDEPDLREILCDEFSLIGAHVSNAPNGKEALKKAQESSFDVVVSDLRMPGGDGVSLARALKSMNEKTPLVLLMTGFADLTAEEAFEIGAEGFLTKPFHLELIRDNLTRLLTPGDQRWAKPHATPATSLEENLEIYRNQAVESYLGRGGFFLAGERLQVRIGQEVGFKVGDLLEGVGIVRWIRVGPSGTRRPGVGIEFLHLKPASLAWVTSKISELQPRAYLPRGF